MCEREATVTLHDTRITLLSARPYGGGAVAFWMNRDQRIENNWALYYAAELAREKTCSLVIVFCLVPDFPGANLRHYDFMLRGLEHAARKAAGLNIPFVMLTGDPVAELPRFISECDIGAVVTDFSPLRTPRRWKDTVAGQVPVPVIEVDAHNIVPCRTASPKREYSAATFRRKVTPLLDDYLVPIPAIEPFSQENMREYRTPDWKNLHRKGTYDRSILPVNSVEPGTDAAYEQLDSFISHRLPRYHLDRNDPTKEAVSGLSPYLHFGQISAQDVALRVRSAPGIPEEAAGAFLEELIVRRELSDNFCCYEPSYDNIGCLPEWARRTLDEHRDDPREYVYSYDELDRALTHDPLWNAAQREMVITGRMHGYMRMYWAKKILEWSSSPEEAIQYAINLNDRYELDGRDPNAYVGVLWSIGGVHDRAWPERAVFGKIRYMSAGGCARKFDVKRYCRYVGNLDSDGSGSDG